MFFFVSVSPDRSYGIDVDRILIEYNDMLKLTWNPEDVLPNMDNPREYFLDIVLYVLDMDSNTWTVSEVLADSVANDGSHDIIFRSDFETVHPAAIQVLVKPPDFITGKGLGSALLAGLRVGLWTRVAYITFADPELLRHKCNEWLGTQQPGIGEEILARLPFCPRTMDEANQPNSGFEEEKFSSYIRISTFDNFYREFFHPDTKSCFRQKVHERLKINVLFLIIIVFLFFSNHIALIEVLVNNAVMMMEET